MTVRARVSQIASARAARQASGCRAASVRAMSPTLFHRDLFPLAQGTRCSCVQCLGLV
jgi:hypothetical protein